MPETEGWKFTLIDGVMPNDTIEVVSPEGFVLHLGWPLEAIMFLAVLAHDTLSDVLTDDTSRFNVVGDDLILVSADPWDNKGFDHGYRVASCGELAFLLAQFVAHLVTPTDDY